MRLNYYIGMAKPKQSRTWLPFAGVVAGTEEQAIKRMKERFADNVGVNRFQNIEDWEFTAATAIIPEGVHVTSDVLDEARKVFEGIMPDLENVLLKLTGAHRTTFSWMTKSIQDHIDKLAFMIKRNTENA